jgi:hypothetical protein
MVWLGRQLNIEGLARLGARLIAQAIRQAPRISEALLGQQEAALRELLRKFREGDTEQALRHALPLNRENNQGVLPAANAQLPTHNVVYNLRSLLSAGQGPGSSWLAAGDVYEALTAEYRKAAELATQRGDYRRAAFIYGMLLHEWRLAATVLERGGLHHDAALLYLEKVSDSGAAARAFEAAGEVDRALELYLAREEHLAAGDLLARAGEHDRALAQYILAAEAEAKRGNAQVAGELLMARAGRPDLAEPHFRAGWGQRPWGTAQGCLLHLLDLYARRLGPADLFALVDEADAFFARDGSDAQAAQFYNALGRQVESEHLGPARDRLRDRALGGLAGRLRRCAVAGQHGPAIVSGLLMPSGPWEPALVRDAEVALRGAVQPRICSRAQVRRVKTHNKRLGAVCFARQTGDLFLGFADGKVVRFDPRHGAECVEQQLRGRVNALSTDDEGRLVVAVGAELLVSWFAGEGRLRVAQDLKEWAIGWLYLSPVFSTGDRYGLAVWDGQRSRYLTGPDLVPEAGSPGPVHLRMQLILSAPLTGRSRFWSLLFDTDSVTAVVMPANRPPSSDEAEPPSPEPMPLRLPWSWTEPGEVSCQPLAWLPLRGRYLEIAGVTKGGGLGWAHLRLFGSDAAVLASQQKGGEPPFLAVALVRPGVVMGVQAGGVFPFFADEGRLQPRPAVRADLGDAVACAYSHATGELLVVTADGDVVRVPVTV